MFHSCRPEEVGISSENIKKYVELLEENRLSTHNVLIARGDKICFEKYWAPFHRDYLHRQYSCTKSFVSLAVGFLIEDGLVDFDDPIEKYFPEEARGKHEYLRKQTIRDMLMMATGKNGGNWLLNPKPRDRVKCYFDNNQNAPRPSGTVFEYDSSGSFVLGAMVERITGKRLLDYLREKCLDEIGFSKEAYCMTCPGGHSWGDSALLCTARDFLRAARFVLNGGEWGGKQLLSREYVSAATSKQIDTNNTMTNEHLSNGYGYQFWRIHGDSFYFCGMGCQFAVCVPEKDMILIYNGDNQGKNTAYEIILDGFFKLVAETASDAPLPEDKASFDALEDFTKDLKLSCAKGDKTSPVQAKINGMTYAMEENPMGLTKFSLEFCENEGKLHYTNARGDKTISFGMCDNAFGIFPEEGYSDEVGGEYAPGHFYKCAASAAWVSPFQLFIKVQIIDKYFGNLNIMIGFKENKATMYMTKAAEDFLEDYQGFAGGEITEA